MMNTSSDSLQTPWEQYDSFDEASNPASDGELPYLTERDLLEGIELGAADSDTESVCSDTTVVDEPEVDTSFYWKFEAVKARDQYITHLRERTYTSFNPKNPNTKIPLRRYVTSECSPLHKRLVYLLCIITGAVYCRIQFAAFFFWPRIDYWVFVSLCAIHLATLAYFYAYALSFGDSPAPKPFLEKVRSTILLNFVWILAASLYVFAGIIGAFTFGLSVVLMILFLAAGDQITSSYSYQVNEVSAKYLAGGIYSLENTLEIRFPKPAAINPGLNRKGCISFYKNHDLTVPLLERGDAYTVYNIAKMRAIYRGLTNAPLKKTSYEEHVKFPSMTLLGVYKFVNEINRPFIGSEEAKKREELFTAELESQGISNQPVHLN